MNLNKNYKNPFYKTVLGARKNVLNSSKSFYFRKKKWEKFNFFSKKQLRFFKRYRFKDQQKLMVSRFTHRGKSFKKNFKFYLTKLKLIQLQYGKLKKKKTKKILTSSNSGINEFEKRLDSVVYKAKFSCSIKQARQIIAHGHVKINNKISKNYNYETQHGDKIKISSKIKSRQLVQENLLKSNFWPIPPLFLQINYSTLTLLVVWKNNGKSDKTVFLPFNMELNSLKNNIRFK